MSILDRNAPIIALNSVLTNKVAMEDSMRKGLSDLIPIVTILCGAAGVVSAVLIAGAAVTLSPRQAQALPAYAQQTGLRCGRCHVNSAGGGPNTAFGKAFAANGHKLPAKKKK